MVLTRNGQVYDATIIPKWKQDTSGDASGRPNTSFLDVSNMDTEHAIACVGVLAAIVAIVLCTMLVVRWRRSGEVYNPIDEDKADPACGEEL
jgi:hypothetical protein